MASLQNVTLTDRTPVTPVVHTFVPRLFDPSTSVGIVANTTGVPVGEELLTVSMKKSASKYRGKVTLSMPVVATEVINGVSSPKVIRTAYARVEVDFDLSSTTQERTNLMGMLADAFATSKTLVHKSMVDLESVW